MVWVRRESLRAGLALSSLGVALAGGCSDGDDVASGPSPLVDAAAEVGGGGGASGAGGSGGGGSSGAAGSAGRGSGGTSAGGSSGSSAGGTAGTAGSIADAAPESGGRDGGRRNCEPTAADDNACTLCVLDECCAELMACEQGASCLTEVVCTQDCVHEVVLAGGVVDEQILRSCTETCATGTTITPETNDLLSCMFSGVRVDGGTGNACVSECFTGAPAANLAH